MVRRSRHRHRAHRLLVALLAGGCAAHAPAPPAAIAPVVEKHPQRAHAGGIDIAWDSFGDPTHPPLLLIMGLGMQMIAWDDELCAMLAARGFYVVRFDNRDVGRSTWLDGAGDPNPLRVFDELRKRHAVTPPYRLADMADDAAALLDALGIRAAHVAGVSMGGMIAQELALRHPERVLSLASIMSATGDPDVRGPSYETIAALLKPFPPDRDGYIARAVELWKTLGGRDDEPRVRQIAARSFDRGYHPSGVRRQLVAIWCSGNRKPALSALRVPTLVLHGDADPLIPVDNGRDTARAIPGARLVVVPGMGHELPRRVWPLLVDELTRQLTSQSK